MRYIDINEFIKNVSHYCELSNEEDIYILDKNKIITVLTNPKQKALQNFLDLPNKLPKVDKNIDVDKIFEDEILRRCGM